MDNLIFKLKQLIITESEKEDILTPEELTDNEPLFGPSSRLNLDSLDALQISVALKEQFGVRLQGDREVRKHMVTVSKLNKYVLEQIKK
ncbi:acyl carrier protein [Gilliamella sp. wkB308]|uniref:acyl carrier protein n=1 Tax=Gilliamella sp. wkB308 TaxID=3120263 RepID=UPI00080E80EF|nr:acyl carrier protein [Gilliamella apicola]OCF95473.1 acyl carrier protein [Gilliamella apicola]